MRLHYVTAGAGDPVVLLHGWPQTWHEWRRLIPALASRYCVIAPDLRGFGDSDKPAGGYDKRTVPETIHRLHQAAIRLVPALGQGRMLEAWAGLRPGTPDDLPTR